MATTNIATDIQNITGVTTANAGFITSAQKFVASKIPKDLLGFAKVKSGDIDTGNHTNDKLSTSKITEVVRDGYFCTQISVEQAAFANDSASLQKSTEKFPTYTIIGDSAGAKLQIHPTPTNSKVANYYFIDPTTIDDDTVLMSAVIYHAVSNEYSKLLNDNMPVFVSVAPPTAPTLSSNSITFNTSVPTYTPPPMGSLDFADTEDLITNEEDSEMLSSRISEINAKISEYSAKIQESQALFNKENTEYQAQLQKSIEDGRLSSQDDAQKIQKFSAELQEYQTKINDELQKFASKLQKTQVYSAEGKKYYDWSVNEITLYIQNNSTILQATMAQSRK
tara:strand:+ start:129 stop:1139 length:1011 start_codon:yes stop_codon:yes gene_type:complete